MRNGDSRAFFLKTLCCGQTDAAVSAGHYRYLSFQSLYHFSRSSLSADFFRSSLSERLQSKPDCNTRIRIPSS
jgi:hypothetical protein